MSKKKLDKKFIFYKVFNTVGILYISFLTYEKIIARDLMAFMLFSVGVSLLWGYEIWSIGRTISGIRKYGLDYFYEDEEDL